MRWISTVVTWMLIRCMICVRRAMGFALAGATHERLHDRVALVLVQARRAVGQVLLERGALRVGEFTVEVLAQVLQVTVAPVGPVEHHASSPLMNPRSRA